MDQLLETIADVIASRVEARIKPLLVPDPTPQLVTVEKAAEILCVSRNTIYTLIGKKELPSVKVLSSQRIPLWAITAYIERNMNDEKAA